MPTDPTPIDPAHAELLAKARAATTGPWTRDIGDDVRTPNGDSLFYAEDHLGNSVGVTVTLTDDADYIAACHPAAIIDLITQLGEARAENERLRKFEPDFWNDALDVAKRAAEHWRLLAEQFDGIDKRHIGERDAALEELARLRDARAARITAAGEESPRLKAMAIQLAWMIHEHARLLGGEGISPGLLAMAHRIVEKEGFAPSNGVMYDLLSEFDPAARGTAVGEGE